MTRRLRCISTVLIGIFGVPVIGSAQVSLPSDGIWISRSQIQDLPTFGPAWDSLVAIASKDPIPGHATLADQDSAHSRNTMAAALVAARLDSDTIRAKVRAAIKSVEGTENSSSSRDNRLLQLGRNLPGYVIAADLIELSTFDARFDQSFRTWISHLRTQRFRGYFRTLASADSHDPANWGAYDGAARAAIAAYLGDAADLARSAEAFQSFTGERTDGRWDFRPDIHDLSWECPQLRVEDYRPINDSCVRDGHELGGLMALDMSRGRRYRWPPRFTSYPRENLTGRTIQAEILYRAGYTSVYRWGNNALLRAAEALRRLSEFRASWFEPNQLAYRIIATRYGKTWWNLPDGSVGRAVAGVDWTHRPGSVTMVAPYAGRPLRQFSFVFLVSS